MAHSVAGRTGWLPYSSRALKAVWYQKWFVHRRLRPEVFAGVHGRSDYTESLKLGEQRAISILRDQQLMYNVNVSHSFTTCDGTPVIV